MTITQTSIKQSQFLQHGIDNKGKDLGNRLQPVHVSRAVKNQVKKRGLAIILFSFRTHSLK